MKQLADSGFLARVVGSWQRHANFWWLIAINAFQETFINRATNALFILGKTVRFAITLIFLFLIKDNVEVFAGYTTEQVVIFFLTYQFLDTLAQVFYRGVYVFSNKIRTGEFDFWLTKPINPLFSALTGKPDINDSFFIIPTTLVSIYIVTTLDITISATAVGWYLLLLANGFLIATGFHILVVALAIFATEVESAIWLYRDLSRLGQFPVNIYFELLRLALFFMVPIGFMITIPAEVLLGLTPTFSIWLTGIVGVGFLLISLAIFRLSLKHYSSASS